MIGRMAILFASGLQVSTAWGQVPVRPDSTRDSVVALPPINVTVMRGTSALQESPLAVTVVDRETLGHSRQDLTLEDILAGIPGVYLSNRYNFSLDQRLSIRGFGSRSNFGLRGVKVLLDGVPQTLPDGQGQLTNIDFGAIERIEVIRGSASSLYGNASGGVIALQSQPPSSLPFSQSARVEGGAFGLFRWQTSTSGRQGPLAGQVSFSRFQLDGFRQHSRAEAFQLRAGVQYLLSGNTTASFQFGHASAPRADNPGALTLAELKANPEAAAPNNITRDAGKVVEQQQASFALRHYGSAADNVTEVTLFGVRRSLQNPLATNTFVTVHRQAGGARFSVSRTFAGMPGSPHLSIGSDIQRMRDDRTNTVATGGISTDSVLIDQVETVTELGPFVHVTLRPTSRLLIASGIRYDAITFGVHDRHVSDGVDNSGSRTMASWSGNLGVSVTGMSAIVPYANVSTSFETPTTTELANRPGSSGGFNDQLNPQRAVNYEAGLRVSHPRLQFSVAVFVDRIRDALIQFSEVGGRAFFRNAGRLEDRGAEIGFTIPGHTVELSGSYTYAHYRFTEYRIVSGAAVDTLDGNSLAGVPAHFMRVALRLAPAHDLRIDLDHQFSSSLFADDENSIRVNGWGSGITTIRAAWTGQTRALEITPFLGINNLFSRDWISSVTVNGFGGRVFEPGPARNIYGGLEVRYSSRR
ncbi:MAG: TonB-dependent receptor [Gemmatimonadota bacterium]